LLRFPLALPAFPSPQFPLDSQSHEIGAVLRIADDPTDSLERAGGKPGLLPS
jgi:hypothetical protein